MERHAAHAARAKARVRVEIDWDNADDHALVGGMLANDERAWLAFLGRFDELLTKRVESTIGQWSRMLGTTDMIEHVKGDVVGHLVSNRMKPLRGFDPRHGTLANWLSRIAHASAMRRLQSLTNVPDDEELDLVEDK
jgi:hypothetical protein